jgi:hypothetical protein
MVGALYLLGAPADEIRKLPAFGALLKPKCRIVSPIAPFGKLFLHVPRFALRHSKMFLRFFWCTVSTGFPVVISANISS